MRRLRLSIIAFALALSACSGSSNPPRDAGTDAGAPSPITALSETERGWFAPSLPAAAKKRVVTIPNDLLTEDDRSYENLTLLSLHNDGEQVVGYAREVFTPVGCTAGACQAIRFVLVFTPSFGFLDIFHPPGTSHDLMKFIDNTYSHFSDEDWRRLKEILANPPAVLLAVTDYHDLVIGASATAPTKVDYQSAIVRGAAFTVYQILKNLVATKTVLNRLFGAGS
jgi:hypothetical protein